MCSKSLIVLFLFSLENNEILKSNPFMEYQGEVEYRRTLIKRVRSNTRIEMIHFFCTSLHYIGNGEIYSPYGIRKSRVIGSSMAYGICKFLI